MDTTRETRRQVVRAGEVKPGDVLVLGPTTRWLVTQVRPYEGTLASTVLKGALIAETQPGPGITLEEHCTYEVYRAGGAS